MGFFLDMPVVIKVLGALFFILLLNSFGRHLAVSLVAGTVLLAAWCGHSPAAAASIVLSRVFSVDHFFLLAVVLQVIWLSSQMAETGVMRDLVDGLRGRLSQRAAVAVLPAVIGLLPMPGGAIFSAPLVADCDRDGALDPLLKTRINYWFRHVWEYWWPLYPGILLLLSITGLDAWQVMLVHLPLSLAAIGVGWVFFLGRIPRAEGGQEPGHERESPPILPLLVPIIVVIAVYAGLRVAVPGLVRISRYAPMMLGLVVATGLLQRQRPLPMTTWRGILFSRRLLGLILLITLVRIYGAFIEARLPAGPLVVEQLRSELEQWGIPVLAVIMVVPFICGVATGLAVGFVGAGFPVVMSILGPDPATGELLASTTLAYGFGYMGMVLSPVHVCLIVTNDHFHTKLPKSLSGLVFPAIAVMVFTLFYSRAVAWGLGP